MSNLFVQKLLKQHMSRREFLGFTVVAGASIFGITRIISELRSQAAGLPAALEPETGALSGGATAVTNAAASGGKVLRFGAPASTPTPTPTATPVTSRDSLVLGTYKPGPTTTGIIPGIALTDVTAASAFTQSGTAAVPLIIQNKRFLNKVNINGCKYVTFKNCAFYGTPKGETLASALKSTNTNNEKLRFEDCFFTHQNATTEGAGAVEGAHNSTFLRCEFRGTSDGIALIHSASPGQTNAHDGPMNLTVHGCYFHDMAYFSPEPTRAPDDNASHADCIQIRGGSNIIIRYNTFVAHLDPNIGAANKPSVDGTDASGNPIHISGNKFYPDLNATSVLMASPHLAPFHEVYFEYNWVDGGSVSINMAEVGTAANASDSGFYVRNNKWGRSMRLGEKATVIAHTSTANNGVLVNTGNTYEDNGQPANFRMNGGA